ncbi:MAG: hypothetical protein ABUL54_00380 [Dongia sp.]
MATMFIQPDAHETSLQIGRWRALGLGLICGAIVVSSLGCVRSDRGSFGTSAFNVVPYQMPSSAVP